MNQFLLNLYAIEIRTITGESPKKWKTFKQWKEDGKQVIKGSKAFKIWSSPKPMKKKESDKKEDKTAFFTCNLFCEFQVEQV